jgi:hypothetical protein
MVDWPSQAADTARANHRGGGEARSPQPEDLSGVKECMRRLYQGVQGGNELTMSDFELKVSSQ